VFVIFVLFYISYQSLFLLKLLYLFVYVLLWYTNIFFLQNIEREWPKSLIVPMCR